MAELTPPANGVPPTKLAKKLAQGTYDDRVLAALDQSRLVGNDVILRTLGLFDPDNISWLDRKRMRQDLMIKLGLHYSKSPMISAEWTMECTDPAIAAAMTEIYENIHVNVMKTGLLKYDWGFKGAIKQFEYGRLDATFENPDTGEVESVWQDDDVHPIIIGDLIPLPVDSTRVHLEKGRFAGIKTPLAIDANKHDGDKPIPPEWCLWFVNEFEEEDRNWYGRARIDAAYRFWYSYWGNYHMRDRHAENDADPALQVWYPPGDYKDTDDLDDAGNPRVKSNRDAALATGAQLRNGATIAWPSSVHVDEQGKLTTQKLWEAAFLTGGENIDAFTELLSDLDIQKLRATLVPEQALVEARRGSGARNVAGEQIDFFKESLEQDSRYMDSIINKYLIRPVVEANWGKDAPACKKKTTGFQEEDLTLSQKLIEVAFGLDPNALPIDFEEMCRRAGLPMYTNAEQKEREEAAEEAKAVAMEEEAALAEASGVPPGEPVPPGAGAPAGLQASQRRKKYDREVIHLASRTGRKAPTWAVAEGKRREHNLSSLSERLQEVVQARYQDVFEAAADVLAEQELSLGVGDTIQRLVAKIVDAVKEKVAGYRGPVEGELASVYHASGASELMRLGLDATSWDVGRDEVQEWARYRAGELITTMDKTVVEKHVRPWLTHVLSTAGYGDTPTGIPVDSLELAQQLTDKFSSYPLWMAERVVRTEARMGYNQSAADMWERVGVQEIIEFDGLGGRTGKTDAGCLRRNGETVTIDQFREDDRDEHPNGTLGGVPVTTNVQLHNIEPGMLVASAVQSPTIYAVSDSGLILSIAEVGRALAGS